jgi:thiamine biosynthesis protein ThiS
MQVSINGEKLEVAESSSIQDVLRQLRIQEQWVVVEHNASIVRREEFSARALQAGDQLEILRFLGGG